MTWADGPTRRSAGSPRPSPRWRSRPRPAPGTCWRTARFSRMSLPRSAAPPARDEHAELTRRARRILAEAALATGEAALAVLAAGDAVSDDPYDEPARRALMRAHVAGGEPARALAAYAALRDVLGTELGADPAAETQALHLAVLREEALPGGGGAPVAGGQVAVAGGHVAAGGGGVAAGGGAVALSSNFEHLQETSNSRAFVHSNSL